MSKQPLNGVKILDFTWVGVGPCSVKYLADNGATVIKVESGLRPDIMRTMGPFIDRKPGLNRSGFFSAYNNNKLGISLNMRHPKAIELIKPLVLWADIVSESFAPGMISEWGLGYDELVKVKPDIIMISMSNQGQEGPHARQPGLGGQLTALAGFFSLTGWPDRTPSIPYGAYTDFIGMRIGAVAMLSALDYHRRTGKGQYIDLSQYEDGLQMLLPPILDYIVNGRDFKRKGNYHSTAAPHNAFRCRGNDKWCSIAVFTDDEWQRLGRIIGAQWINDQRFATVMGRKENETELDKLIEEWTINFTAEEVMTTLQANSIAAGVVKNAEDLSTDPQLKHRNHFQVLNHPEMGDSYYESMSFRLSKTPGDINMPAPCLGQYNEYVFTQIAGLSDEEFINLMGEGVFD